MRGYKGVHQYQEPLEIVAKTYTNEVQLASFYNWKLWVCPIYKFDFVLTILILDCFVAQQLLKSILGTTREEPSQPRELKLLKKLCGEEIGNIFLFDEVITFQDKLSLQFKKYNIISLLGRKSSDSK